jgi:hypothetical protein
MLSKHRFSLPFCPNPEGNKFNNQLCFIELRPILRDVRKQPHNLLRACVGWGFAFLEVLFHLLLLHVPEQIKMRVLPWTVNDAFEIPIEPRKPCPKAELMSIHHSRRARPRHAGPSRLLTIQRQ